MENSIRNISEQKFYYIAHLSPVGVFQTDNDGNCVYVNKKWCELAGMTPEEAYGQGWIKALHPDDKQRIFDEWYAAAKSSLPFKSKYRFLNRTTQSETWLLGQSMVLIEDNKQAGWVGTITDITEEQRTEEALELANKTKSAFLAVMSHEIRTPLHGILGTLELLSLETTAPSQRDLVNTAIDCSKHLSNLISDCLDFSRLEARKLKLEEVPFSLNETINEVTRIMSPLSDKKNLELDCVISEELQNHMLLGDPWRLKQILFNLVGNAIKFTKAGKVCLNVKRRKQEINNLDKGPNTEHIEVRVTDTGPGIPPDRVGELFKPFSQLSTVRNGEGTGLGLAISHQIVELLGGSIWVEPLSTGTTFAFTAEFPIDQQNPALPRCNSENFNSLKSISVLLVEDNLLNQKIAKSMLSSFGCEVSTANNGLEAVAMVAEKDYDICLMDIQMPKMDGLTATKEIRTIEKTNKRKRLPIIAMTASVDNVTEYISESIGMDGYFSKPISRQELKQSLTAFIKRM